MSVVPSKIFIKTIEASTKSSAEQLRNTTISQRRRIVEEKSGKPTRFKSFFPLIGRGSVLHGKLISHEQVEDAVEKSLKQF